MCIRHVGICCTCLVECNNYDVLSCVAAVERESVNCIHKHCHSLDYYRLQGKEEVVVQTSAFSWDGMIHQLCIV